MLRLERTNSVELGIGKSTSDLSNNRLLIFKVLKVELDYGLG